MLMGKFMYLGVLEHVLSMKQTVPSYGFRKVNNQVYINQNSFREDYEHNLAFLDKLSENFLLYLRSVLSNEHKSYK